VNSGIRRIAVATQYKAHTPMLTLAKIGFNQKSRCA